LKNPAKSATVAATQSVNNPPMSIYTRTGDDGTTSLYGGKRVSKSDPRVDLYGSIDELSSWIGSINDSRLTEIQQDLFTIGSILAGWHGDLNTIEPRMKEMEAWIDEMDKKLPKLTNFILPNGLAHIARSVCRRAEREAVKHKVDPIIIKYLNRLSDLLFTLARFINRQGKIKETVWSGIPRK
jgi:cob(I)alamin adenosyltransferase